VKYLLDTCCWIWLAQNPEEISATAAACLEDESADCFICVPSVMEITMKHASGRLELEHAPRDWVANSIVFHQLSEVEYTTDVIFLSGELPPAHMDPFARLIAATAIRNGMTILSPDKKLSLLGASRIW
jgi:PIN domain nuclease of toxin-antitoxin system